MPETSPIFPDDM